MRTLTVGLIMSEIKVNYVLWCVHVVIIAVCMQNSSLVQFPGHSHVFNVARLGTRLYKQHNHV